MFTCVNKLCRLGMMACASNPNTGRQRQETLCQFKTSLVYVESSRIARVAWKDPPSKKEKKKKQKVKIIINNNSIQLPLL